MDLCGEIDHPDSLACTQMNSINVSTPASLCLVSSHTHKYAHTKQNNGNGSNASMMLQDVCIELLHSYTSSAH